MKFTPKQEMLALGVRGARHKRDLLAKKYKVILSGKTSKVAQDRAITQVGNQDDVVQAHLRQFKNSLIPKKEVVDEIEYQEI